MQKKDLVPNNQHIKLVLSKSNSLLSLTHKILNNSSLAQQKTNFRLSISLGHNSETDVIEITEDGKYAVSGDQSGVIKLWCIETGTLLKTFQADNERIGVLVISSNLEYIVSLSYCGYRTDYINIWDIKSEKIIKTFSLYSSFSSSNTILSISNDNKYIISTLDNNDNKRIDSSSKKSALTLTGIKDDYERTFRSELSDYREPALFHEMNPYMIRTNWKNEIELVNIFNDQETIFNFSEKPIVSLLTFSDSYKYIVFRDYRTKSLIILNTKTKKDLRIAEKNARNISALVISKKEQYIIYSYTNCDFSSDLQDCISYHIKLMNIETGKIEKTFKLPDKCSDILFVSSDDKYIIFEAESSLYKLDLGASAVNDLFSINCHSSHPLSFHFDSIASLSFMNNCRYIIACSKHLIYLIETETGKLIQTFKEEGLNINSIAITKDEKYLITGSSYDDSYSYGYEHAFNALKVWDINNGQQIKSSLDTDKDVKSVLITPDNKYIVSNCHYKSIQLWNMQTKELDYTIEGNSEITALTISYDGKYLAYGDWRGEISLWSFDSKKVVKTFQTYDSKVLSIEMIQDNKVIIVANSYDANDCEYDDYIEFDNDHNLTFLDIEDNNNINIVCEDDMHISKLKITPDNKNVVMVGINSFILWNIKSKKIINTFKEYTGYADCISISPDSNYIISSSYNQPMILWDLNTGDKLMQYQVSTNNEYIATTPSGLYGCSKEAQKYIAFLDDSYTLPKVIDKNNSIYTEKKRNKLINLKDV
jgi:WD40 repeat protein